MSSGRFVIRAYSLTKDPTKNHPIRVQPETLALEIGGVANGDAVGGINSFPRVNATGSRRRQGINARLVRIAFTEGNAPEGYKEGSVITLPWLRSSTFDALVDGTTGTYLGAPIYLVGTTPEKVR